MLILTIESSCDETSAAVVRDGRVVLSNAVASQIPVHRRYGGVVPELASRNHIRDIHTVIDEALETAGVALSEIDGFGVTAGPGLVGSLLVGVETAKSLAWAHDRPCVGLNHLEGHLTAVLLELPEVPAIEFPYLGVIVSGGHTDLYVVEAPGVYVLLGRTRDDAAGEAFDKVGKMLGLHYPAGAEIDRLARDGDPKRFKFPRPMWTKKHFDFSFSGLKTAVLYAMEELGTLQPQDRADICASFQAAATEVIVYKAMAAAAKYGTRQIVYSGGVACNSGLRAHARERADAKGREAVFAPPNLCTDNAAMLGPIGHLYLSEMPPRFDAFTLRATSNLPFGRDERAVSATPDRHR